MTDVVISSFRDFFSQTKNLTNAQEILRKKKHPRDVGMSLLALCIGVGFGPMLGLVRVSVKCTNIHHLKQCKCQFCGIYVYLAPLLL